MPFEFFDSYPYRPLGTDLKPLLPGARRVDAAIAFVTRPGVALLRDTSRPTRPAPPDSWPASDSRPTSMNWRTSKKTTRARSM